MAYEVITLSNNNERKLKYKTNPFLNFQREKVISINNTCSSCYGQSFFHSFFFFNDGTTGIGEEKCASFDVSKNCDNAQVS